MITHSELARAAAVAREVDLTTFGRATGRPSRRTIWITTDALGRISLAASCLTTRRSADASRTGNLRTDASRALIVHRSGAWRLTAVRPDEGGSGPGDGRRTCNV